MMHDDTALYYWGGAFLIALVSIGLFFWAFASDRSAGRKRCGKCWYSMDHAPTLRCPECGHVAKNDRALRRTRPRWKLAMVSLLPLPLAVFLGVQPKVQQDGWGSVMPTTALILLLRIDDPDWVLDGIEHRITEWQPVAEVFGFNYTAQGRLWRWQWRMLGRSILMRMELEERIEQRTNYHSWLLACAEEGGDPALRQESLDALARDLTHPDANVRYSAAIFSIDYEDIDGSIARAVEMVELEDSSTRISGMTSLSLIATRTGQGVPALIEALQHEDAEVRRHALFAIGSTAKYARPVPEAFDPVYALEHDASGEVRYRRIQTLADLQSEEDAWKTIDAALHHDDPDTRRGGLSAASFRTSRPPHIEQRMIECLGDPDAAVRVSAMWLIIYIPKETLAQHTELLESFLNHDDPEVRRVVTGLLN